MYDSQIFVKQIIFIKSSIYKNSKSEISYSWPKKIKNSLIRATVFIKRLREGIGERLLTLLKIASCAVCKSDRKLVSLTGRLV